MVLTINRTSSLLTVCKTPHTSCLIFLSFPPSLAWGFYNSLRRKSIASYKEPQVRNTSLIQLPFLCCADEHWAALRPACFNMNAACFAICPKPPPGLPPFLFSLHVHTWQSSFDLILLVLVVNVFRCWIFLSHFCWLYDLFPFLLLNFNSFFMSAQK